MRFSISLIIVSANNVAENCLIAFILIGLVKSVLWMRLVWEFWALSCANYEWTFIQIFEMKTNKVATWT